MSKMHTLAFQIADDMYVAIKGYLDQYKLITNQKISQRSFILKLIKDQLSTPVEEYVSQNKTSDESVESSEDESEDCQ